MTNRHTSAVPFFFIKLKGKKSRIAVSSVALSKLEQGYTLIQKEAIAGVFELKKIYKYPFGRSSFFYSDRQPLADLFVQEKHVPLVLGARMRRWATLLVARDNRWLYRKCCKWGRCFDIAAGKSEICLQCFRKTGCVCILCRGFL